MNTADNIDSVPLIDVNLHENLFKVQCENNNSIKFNKNSIKSCSLRQKNYVFKRSHVKQIIQ